MVDFHDVLRDVFVDLVQFVGPLRLGQSIRFRSLHQLLHYEHYWSDTNYLLVYAKPVFTGIVQKLVEYRLGQLIVTLDLFRENPFHPSFFFDFDITLFRQTVMVHFIQWMSRTASSDLAFRRLMVSSGIVGPIEATSRRSSCPIYDPQNNLEAEQAQ
ncbi:hypothetical protein VKT23_015978 [Stygiomarasmius scandens]|uniref:Uncharacterized protein n=1 Tax=Marasmiellus scandens TaxID=2682957 RepID=A0ABR1J0K2_9AGAR